MVATNSLLLVLLLPLSTSPFFLPSTTVQRVPTFLDDISKRAEKNRSRKVEQVLSAPLKRPDDPPATTPESIADPIFGAAAPSAPKTATTTTTVDQETGFRQIAEGRAVMDPVTRLPVALSNLGDDARLAQFFPGVPPATLAKLRIDPSTVTVEQLIAGLKSSIKDPTKPVCDDSLDFVIANRDQLGLEMKKTLSSIKLRHQSLGDLDQARLAKTLRDNYLVLENKISGPFRQMVLEAEQKIGPNFANLDIKSYAGKAVYERAATWLVLQAMRAIWEKKTRDANYYENNTRTRKNTMEYLCQGEPDRFNPDSERKYYNYEDTLRMCTWAQKMSVGFSQDEAMFNDLPPEVRFIDRAITITGGTELRRFAVEEFCPTNNLDAASLREGIRRLLKQMENMQPNPYGYLTRIIEDMSDALAAGTPDERNIYNDYLYAKSGEGKASFQTYQFERGELDMIKFLENEVDVKEGGVGPIDEVLRSFGFGGVIDAVNEKKDGRPMELGWLEALDEERGEFRGGNYKSAQTIKDEEDEARREEVAKMEQEAKEEDGAVVEAVFAPDTD